MPDDDRKPPEEDKFRPDAIAARIDKLGADTETDAERIEREEEHKLLERKRGRGKTGLEAAASKRLAKIGEGTVKRPVRGAAVPEALALFDRADRANKWIKEHAPAVAAMAAAGVLGLGALLGWVVWQDRRTTDASVLLAQGLADEHGYVAAPGDDDDTPTSQLYPTFKSSAERRDAALAKYRGIEAKYPGTGAAILARLAEASLLLDGGDAKGAIAAYADVEASALARADPEVRGRALEGTGFARELLAQIDAAGREGHLDGALAEFKALEAVDVDGFKELGMYHRARVLLAKGDKKAALDLLKDVQARISEAGADGPFSYLRFVVEDRLRELDPTALPPREPPVAAGGRQGSGNVDMNDPKIREILRRLQQQQTPGGGSRVPEPPGSTP